MGHRAFNPHTTVRISPYASCRTCHPSENEDNAARLRETMGFGTDRFIETDGEGREWVLDRLMDPETYAPEVVVGHDEPEVSRPLPRETIEAMMRVTVP